MQNFAYKDAAVTMIQALDPSRIVYGDNHLLAVDKPAGVPSQPDASGDPSLIDMAKAWVKEKYAKPGAVYLALLHRLDRPVSGIVLTARTDKAASRLADAFRRRAVAKRYLALVECAAPPEAAARLEDRLADNGNGGSRIVASGGTEARLSYTTLGRSAEGGRALLLVDLETGGKHQIRVQLASKGLPIVGDFRYGAFGKPARPEPVAGGRAILLHAAGTAFEHPVGKGRLDLRRGPPGHWRRHLAGLELDRAAGEWLNPGVETGG